jgi:hypothetical protein
MNEWVSLRHELIDQTKACNVSSNDMNVAQLSVCARALFRADDVAATPFPQGMTLAIKYRSPDVQLAVNCTSYERRN